eukprot:TRINITY_DN9081_c0_g1_i1.p1 TRINITY_DN9081_c0_g1~~TRINITY_DN9081_c0_g1_i1.p1  ORF type:complete len:130 (-),score=17.72 TRINITY_DN9081_c0_g1_i1:12-401(-)
MEDLGHINTDWRQLGERYTRKIDIYNMAWRTTLGKYQVAVGKNGGPIALYSRESVPFIEITSSSGVNIVTIPWDRSDIIQMGWTDQERLVCVTIDGIAVMMDVRGKTMKEFSTGAVSYTHLTLPTICSV